MLSDSLPRWRSPSTSCLSSLLARGDTVLLSEPVGAGGLEGSGDSGDLALVSALLGRCRCGSPSSGKFFVSSHLREACCSCYLVVRALKTKFFKRLSLVWSRRELVSEPRMRDVLVLCSRRSSSEMLHSTCTTPSPRQLFCFWLAPRGSR